MIGAAGATGRAEARDFLHALGERGNLQSPQHIHWVWGEKAQEQNCYDIFVTLRQVENVCDKTAWFGDQTKIFKSLMKP